VNELFQFVHCLRAFPLGIEHDGFSLSDQFVPQFPRGVERCRRQRDFSPGFAANSRVDANPPFRLLPALFRIVQPRQQFDVCVQHEVVSLLLAPVVVGIGVRPAPASTPISQFEPLQIDARDSDSQPDSIDAAPLCDPVAFRPCLCLCILLWGVRCPCSPVVGDV